MNPLHGIPYDELAMFQGEAEEATTDPLAILFAAHPLPWSHAKSDGTALGLTGLLHDVKDANGQTPALPPGLDFRDVVCELLVRGANGYGTQLLSGDDLTQRCMRIAGAVRYCAFCDLDDENSLCKREGALIETWLRSYGYGLVRRAAERAEGVTL